MAKKSDNSVINQRVKEIIEMKLSGKTRSDILEYGSKWNISDQSIDSYISSATKRLNEINTANIEDTLSTIATNLWTLYRASVSQGNLKEAHAILMSVAKLKGLDKINIVITEDKRELANMTDQELDSMFEEHARH